MKELTFHVFGFCVRMLAVMLMCSKSSLLHFFSGDGVRTMSLNCLSMSFKFICCSAIKTFVYNYVVVCFFSGQTPIRGLTFKWLTHLKHNSHRFWNHHQDVCLSALTKAPLNETGSIPLHLIPKAFAFLLKVSTGLSKNMLTTQEAHTSNEVTLPQQHSWQLHM